MDCPKRFRCENVDTPLCNPIRKDAFDECKEYEKVKSLYQRFKEDSTSEKIIMIIGLSLAICLFIKFIIDTINNKL